jgi:integrase
MVPKRQPEVTDKGVKGREADSLACPVTLKGQRRARRAVTIPEFVTFEIAEHLRRCPPGPSGLVFTAPKGGPIRRQTFLPPSLGGRRYRPPISRASGSGSCATLARRWRWRGGANPVIVAFRLGHTSTRMVEQHYAGRLDRADKEIASALDAAARMRHAEGTWNARSGRHGA